MKDTITEVSKYQRGWSGGLPETPCGFGSRVENTVIQRDFIAMCIARYDIHTIADIGAGDLNWVYLTEWPHEVDYRPYDLVPRKPNVKQFDIIQQVPEPVDCLMVLWLLNHLPQDHAFMAVENLQASGSKYLMYTYEPRQWDCTDLGYTESVVIRKRNDERGNVEIRLLEC